jgi:DNA-binding transcriptional MerR regulator
MPSARLTISEVHRRTGIPVTTLRFYERELPDFFTIEKTAGGHRRYTDESVRQFAMVKRMVETEGIRLSDIRTRLVAREDKSELRRQVDLLLSVHDAMTQEIDQLRVRIESLEIALESLRRAAGSARREPEPKKKRWF